MSEMVAQEIKQTEQTPTKFFVDIKNIEKKLKKAKVEASIIEKISSAARRHMSDYQKLTLWDKADEAVEKSKILEEILLKITA